MELRPYLWMNSKNIEPLGGVNVLWCNYWCLIGTLSTQRLNSYCGKCGRWYWPRSCNWGDPS